MHRQEVLLRIIMYKNLRLKLPLFTPKCRSFLILKNTYSPDVIEFQLQSIHSYVGKDVCITRTDTSRNCLECTISQFISQGRTQCWYILLNLATGYTRST